MYILWGNAKLQEEGFDFPMCLKLLEGQLRVLMKIFPEGT